MDDISSRRILPRPGLRGFEVGAVSIVYLVLSVLTAGALEAQLRFEVDHSSGREIVNDESYGLREIASVDPVRGLIYAVDAGDPLVVTVFAIADGSVVAKLGGSEGDGPGELNYMVAIDATDQGVLATDHTRVNHWSLDGTLVAVWRPLVPGVHDVCAMRNSIAVPLPGDGVLLRTETGDELTVGEGRVGGNLMVDDLSEVNDAVARYTKTKITCVGDHAYVLSGHRLFGYSVTGARREVVLPDELVETGRRRVESARRGAIISPYRELLHDDHGRLVVTMWRSKLAAAVVDPQTECYSIVEDPRPSSRRQYAGMYRDSVLVMDSPPVTRVVDGKPRQVIYAGTSSVVALRPLVAAGGEPCRPGSS